MQTGNIKIRKAELSDLTEIGDLWIELMDYHKELDPFYTRSPQGSELFKEYLAKQMKSSQAAIFVTVDSEKVAGYTVVSISEYPPVFQKSRYGIISDLAVTKHCRGKGTGKLLFQTSQQWFSKNNIDRIELWVSDANVNACGFWRKMGFTPFITTMYREENQDSN
ncbi:MAG: GNAT family N-acetyltransferase [Candidatus Fermentibacteria bacterium]|nr:GNAT family N-acetyltransferase [Candidatus Fermentibacteria bacterium]